MTLQNVKNIKGATDKNRLKNVTCKEGLRVPTSTQKLNMHVRNKNVFQ